MLTAEKRSPLVHAANGSGKPKRVAFIFNHSSFLGGGEISFFELIKRLDTTFIEPLIIVPGKGEIETSVLSIGLDVKVHPFPALRSFAKARPLWALLELSKILRTNNIDLIHANGSRVCFYAGIASSLLNIPLIWHVRETKKDIRVYDKLLARFASAIICVSKSVSLKRFGKFGLLINDKIYVVYNGVDTETFNIDTERRRKIRQKLGIGNPILFGIVGNLIPLKGQDFFLKAIAEVRKYQPYLKVKAVFFGRCLDAEYEKKLKRLAADLKIEEDIIFNGYCHNIHAYLSALDIFILPSKREGCSRALLEAMSVGLPVIASKISENEEVVKSGENAILVPYGDISKMTKAIIELAENKELRKNIGKQNRKRAQTVFSMRSHVNNIQGIYEKVLMKTGGKTTYAHSH